MHPSLRFMEGSWRGYGRVLKGMEGGHGGVMVGPCRVMEGSSATCLMAAKGYGVTRNTAKT